MNQRVYSLFLCALLSSTFGQVPTSPDCSEDATTLSTPGSDSPSLSSEASESATSLSTPGSDSPSLRTEAEENTTTLSTPITDSSSSISDSTEKATTLSTSGGPECSENATTLSTPGSDSSSLSSEASETATSLSTPGSDSPSLRTEAEENASTLSTPVTDSSSSISDSTEKATTLSTPGDDSSSLSTETTESTSLPPTCQVVCNNDSSPPDDNDFAIAANSEYSVLVIVNVSSQAQYWIDFKAGLFGLRNGKTLLGVIINPKTKEGILTTPESGPIGEYSRALATTKGLGPIFKSDKYERFMAGSESSNILRVENDILNHLIEGIEDELKTNPRVGVQLSIAIANRFLQLHETSLRGIINFLGIEGIRAPGDLVMVYNVVNALDIFFSKIPGGILGLTQKGVKINLKQIGVAPNGLRLLESLFRDIGKTEDLGKDLGRLLNDPEIFLNFIVKLGGQLNTGVTGLLKVVSTTVKFLNKNATLEEVINAILQVLAANKERESDLSTELKQSLSGLIKAVEEAGCTDSLAGLLNTLKSLRKGSFKIEGVNISEIISLLITATDSSNDLEAVVNILRELRNVVGIEQSLPRLLLVLILHVNNPLGIELLRSIGIEIEIEVRQVTGSIIRHIIKSLSDIANRLTQDVYGALCTLPIIDKIIEPLKGAMAACDVEEDLKDLIDANELVNNLIKAVFQVIGGLELQIPNDACERVLQTANRCSSLNFYLSVDVDITIVA